MSSPVLFGTHMTDIMIHGRKESLRPWVTNFYVFLGSARVGTFNSFEFQSATISMNHHIAGSLTQVVRVLVVSLTPCFCFGEQCCSKGCGFSV